MTKKERIRLLIGIGVMVVIFVAIASIGWTQDECLITYYYGFDGKYEMHTVKKGYQRKPLEPGHGNDCDRQGKGRYPTGNLGRCG